MSTTTSTRNGHAEAPPARTRTRITMSPELSRSMRIEAIKLGVSRERLVAAALHRLLAEDEDTIRKAIAEADEDAKLD